MNSSAEALAVEVIRAESGRFRHPLLMLHGAWTGGWIWAGLAAYLAHRGWDAWLPTTSGASPETRCAALVELARDLPAAPILVAHDAGLATAIDVAAVLSAPAIVSIAPLVSDGHRGGIVGDVTSWIARLVSDRMPPPGGDVLAGLTAEAADRLAEDSRSFYDAGIAAVRRPHPTTRPVLFVAGPNDRLARADAVEDLARRWGASFDLHESAGHFPMLEPGFERLGDGVHRWLVRALGEHLLVMLDDDDQGD